MEGFMQITFGPSGKTFDYASPGMLNFLSNPMLDSTPDPAALRKKLEDEAAQAARENFLSRDDRRQHLGRFGTILTARTPNPTQVGAVNPGTVIGRPFQPGITR
jgi:hypothetical protein